MNAKISAFVICVEAVILLSYICMIVPLRFAKKMLLRLLFLCSYTVAFYLVKFKSNSIVNSSKIPILKILKFSTFNDVFC